MMVFMIFPYTAKADVIANSNLNGPSYVKPGKTYYIRCHQNAKYLYAPYNASAGTQLQAGTCTDYDNRYKWKIVAVNSGADNTYFYIQSVAYPSLCIDILTAGSNNVALRAQSAGYSTSKWKLIIQTDYAMRFGTYRINNVADSSRSLADTENSTNRIQAIPITNNGYASWVFEEVLSATSSTPAAPPVSHNYTQHTNGYTTGHYARDIAPKSFSPVPNGRYNYPLYADKNGNLTYWTSQTSVGGVTRITRIGNFATLKHADGSGVLYAHMNDFYNGYTAPQYASIAGSNQTFNPVQKNASPIYVYRGQIIGYLGQTGSVYTSTDTNNHMHIEYYNNYDLAWTGATKWYGYSNWVANQRDPKNYMKMWWA